jgi:RpiB/LacA/LacB family sugar-phosphate isomerase
MSMRTVVLASDHAGFDLKNDLVQALRTRDDLQVIDLGPATADRVDYPDFAAKLARQVVGDDADFGVLVCGSGIGMSIAANKVPGARAALVHDELTARLARQHNDARIVCVGSRTMGPLMAQAAVDAFLGAEFEGGRHAGRVAKIHGVETAG